ncbi:MAG: hypothetical protein QM705_02645 [Ancrocorticia sp.]
MSDRLAMARQILMQAETAVGLERSFSGGRGSDVMPTEEPLGRAREAWGGSWGEMRSDQTGWSVPEGLRAAFPYGLRRGSTVGVDGSRLLGLLILGLVSAQGAWVACVGVPDMGWGTARLLGVNFERLVFVPRCMDPLLAQAVSTAIDGFDVVLVGSQVVLGSREKRLLARRALSRKVLLIGEGWEVREQVHGQLIAAEGASAGSGHIRELLLDVFRPGGKPVRVSINARGWGVREKLQLVAGMPREAGRPRELVLRSPEKTVPKNAERRVLRSAEEGSPGMALSGISESVSVRVTPERTNKSVERMKSGRTRERARAERVLEMVPL